MVKSVFISSTSKDLAEHRAAVDKAIRRLGMRPINMDDFGSQPGGASGVSVREVSKADIFVGIIARRYGYIPDGMDKAVTEQEYDEAVRRNLPRLMYLLDPTHDWPEDRIEADEIAQTKLAAFRARIEKNEVRSLFRTPEDLAVQVTADLTKLDAKHQRQGRTTRWLIGLAVVVAVMLLAGVGLLSALPQEQRSTILYSVGLVPASATPTATATNTPTSTSTPTPTATFTPSTTPTSTPEFAKARQGEILIIVAEFANPSAVRLPTGETMAEQLNDVIEDASREAQADYDLQVRVARTAEIVTTKERARAISFANQATIVIWGEVDSAGIKTNYEIAQRWGQEFGSVIDKTSFTALFDEQEVAIRFRRTTDQAYVTNFVIGQILVNSGQYQAAVSLFETTVALVEDEPIEILRDLDAGKIYTLLGALYGVESLQFGDNKLSPAVTAFTRAIEIDPRSENLSLLYRSLGSLYSLQGQYDEALVYFDQIIEIEPNNGEFYAYRGNIYALQGNYREALKDYQQAIDLEPELADGYIGRANLLMEEERYEEALDDYAKVLTLDPNNSSVWTGRGQIFALQGEYEAAISAFDQGIEQCADVNIACAIIYNERGKAYSNLEQYEAAMNDFKRAVELDSSYNPALYRLGLLSSIQGQFEEAIDYLDRSIATCDANCYLDYSLRGDAYSATGDNTAAIADYSSSLELNPDYYFPYYSRGLIYLQQEKYELAVDDFTNSIALCTEACYFDYVFRSAAYTALGDFENALLDSNQAIALNPDFPNLYLVRGSNYLALGDMRAAQDYWQWLELTQTEMVEGNLLEHGETPFTTTIQVQVGTVYQLPFEGQAGEQVNVLAMSREETIGDPLIGILDPTGQPLIFNDDIIPEENPNSQIQGYVLLTEGVYTLVVGQAGRSAEGEINLTLSIDAAETSIEVTAEATP